MKRQLSLPLALLAAASLSLFATSAFAQGGLNLSWDDCGTSGIEQKNFACASNSGANVLFASVVAGVAMGQLNGQEGVIDLQTNQAALSDWWKIGGTGTAPNCRPGTVLTSNFDFVAGPFNCVDAWAGSGAGGINYVWAFEARPNRARIRTVCAIPGSTSITSTDEYYMFKVTMTNARSTGTGSCAGCGDGACIVLNSIKLTQPAGVGDNLVINAFGRRHVLWQAGGSTIGGLGCPAEVPTRSQTWGSVKSLYR